MSTEPLIDILTFPDREACNELSLVLAAQGIPADVRWNGSAWVLSVPERSAASARLEIEAYRTEKRLSVPKPPEARPDGDPRPGILIYSVVLVLMALIAPGMVFDIDWRSAGRVDGELILNGEWWRTITALTLHADAAHLLGNLLFGSFFAWSVSRYLGSGFGWLVIIVCAALGNGLNVLLLGADHRSIGASTAVFAALGLLSSYLWRHGFPSNASRRERLAPVAAGIGLLAFTGVGGIDTDVGAHLFGFVAGFVGGLAVARFGVPNSSRARTLAAAAAFLLPLEAWVLAVSAWQSLPG
jgi:rhomboid protease GluP